MGFLNSELQQQVREMLAPVTQPVKLVVFTQSEGALECEMCSDTRQLLEEVATLSDQISVEVHDFVADAGLAAAYGLLETLAKGWSSPAVRPEPESHAGHSRSTSATGGGHQ